VDSRKQDSIGPQDVGRGPSTLGNLQQSEGFRWELFKGGTRWEAGPNLSKKQTTPRSDGGPRKSADGSGFQERWRWGGDQFRHSREKKRGSSYATGGCPQNPAESFRVFERIWGFRGRREKKTLNSTNRKRCSLLKENKKKKVSKTRQSTDPDFAEEKRDEKGKGLTEVKGVR